MVSCHDKQKTHSWICRTTTSTRFVPFCFIFLTLHSSSPYFLMWVTISCTNTYPYFLTLLLSLLVPIHSMTLVIYLVRLLLFLDLPIVFLCKIVIFKVSYNIFPYFFVFLYMRCNMNRQENCNLLSSNAIYMHSCGMIIINVHWDRVCKR